MAQNDIGDEQDLPNGWAWTTIGDLVVKMSNGITRRQSKEKVGIPVTRIETISDGTINLDRVRYLPGVSQELIDKYRLLPGDILFSHINSDFHLGKTALFELGELALLHGMNLLLLRTDQSLVVSEYLHYLCNHYRFSGFFVSIAQHAVNQSSINQAKLKAVPMPLAPLPEQHRIVAEIETQFTRLEAGVAALKRAQANLRRYKASVLKAACEGRLVPTEAALALGEGREYEPAGALLERILAERRAKWEAENPRKRYKEPTSPDTSDLPALPRGWVWTNMQSLTVRGPQNGLYLPKSAYGSGVPILRIDDFQDGESRASDELRQVKAETELVKKYGLNKGDLVINRVNSPSHLGKSLVVLERNLPSLFESNMMRLRMPEIIGAQFVEFYLRSPFGRSQLTKNAKWAVNQASINQKDVGNTPVPLPSSAEQHRIVAEVERRLSVVQELEKQAEAVLRRAERLWQAILKHGFEGKLVPQNPGDEPASVLLERIKAERAGQDRNSKGRRAGRCKTKKSEKLEQLKLL